MKRKNLRIIFLIFGLVFTLSCRNHSSTKNKVNSHKAISKIAFESNRSGNSDIYIMNSDGSEVKQLTSNPAEDRSADWSPDGSSILFVSDRDQKSEIYIITVDGGEVKRLTNNDIREESPKWSPDGNYISYHSNKTGVNKVQIFKIGANGLNEQEITDLDRDNLSVTWSPDGKWIATESAKEDKGFDSGPRRNQIWIQNLETAEAKQITFMEAYNGYPSWSPDGKQLIFDCNKEGSANDDGHADIYIINIDGTGTINLSNSLGYNEFGDWSADGSKIAFVSSRDGNNEIYIMNSDGTLQTRITNNNYDDTAPSWSPF